MDSFNFGKYIRVLRKNKGLTLRQLAELSTVSQSYITNVENGKRGVPSPDILKKLSATLGVNYEELMIKAGHLPGENDLSRIVNAGKELSDKAKGKSLLSNSFLESFEKQLVRIIELYILIENPDTKEANKNLYYEEMQGNLNNAIYGINKIKGRLEKSLEPTNENISNPNEMEKIYKQFEKRGYIEMMKKAGYISTSPPSSDSDFDYSQWLDIWFNNIIPCISVNEDRFYPVIEEEIDDFIFDEAPLLRNQIAITPKGIVSFAKNNHKGNEAFIMNLIYAMLPMSYRFKSITMDDPGFNRNIIMQLDSWLEKGTVSYKGNILTDQDKQRVLNMLNIVLPGSSIDNSEV